MNINSKEPLKVLLVNIELMENGIKEQSARQEPDKKDLSPGQKSTYLIKDLRQIPL